MEKTSYNPEPELAKEATLNAISYNKARTKIIVSKVIAGVIFLVLGIVGVAAHFGAKIPGSYFERHKYEGMYYVNLFPDGQKVKSYRVPAMVFSYLEATSSYVDGNGDTQDVFERVYKIQFAIMPNGGKVHFDNSYGFKNLELNKIVAMCDDNKRYWGIELTNRPVPH